MVEFRKTCGVWLGDVDKNDMDRWFHGAVLGAVEPCYWFLWSVLNWFLYQCLNRFHLTCCHFKAVLVHLKTQDQQARMFAGTEFNGLISTPGTQLRNIHLYVSLAVVCQRSKSRK